MSGIARHHSEWLSLIEVSGPFLTLPVLVRVFPQGLPKVDGKKLGRLRAAYEEWANAQDAKAPDAGALHATWVQLVLGELLEFDDQTLRSGDGLPSGLDVPLAEHHETLRPSIAIVEPSGRTKAGTPRLLVAVWPSNQDLESAVPAARWAASPLERMTQLCRSAGVRLGLVTNGERWTVVDAPVGQTAGYASWYAGLWLQEPITLAAFDALLGVRRFFAVADTDTIEALLDESVAFQQEVTDQLGYQVRRAVEVLVQALDRADLDRNRELLRDVPPARLYDAALTVMMRLVFLFCAEERGLLLLGDETYDTNYAVSTLRALLREEADRVGVEVLERRQDAWARLLATFRAVHGGVEHEALRLPALGGSLFDPDRFPFLEGRAAGTSWLATPASPLPIDNRTVLHLLEALQLLRTRGDGGASEARKLSYRALDIEQIGHVYEGLLDHVAVRVDTDTLGLLGTKDKEPELSLDELKRERRHGTDGLIGFLKEHTGRSTSALRNDLDAELDEVAEQRLLVACGNDRALVKDIAPYHALPRKDVWGYPQIYRAGSFMVTGGSERRQTGTHYTPKSLTEQIVTETLEPLVYVGPAQGKPRDAWKLRSAVELLDLKICDMAMGSGAFLVQVCRWLAERIVEAWEEAERQGAAISADGEVLEKAAGHDLLPPDREERLSFARRLVAERCIYGVDINPMAVELAKLSLWLVTLAKGRPFGFLDHNLKSGDSLLGIHRLNQLTELSIAPTGQSQLRLFSQNIERAVSEAVERRSRLREMPIHDIHDVEAMAHLDADARRKLEAADCIADAFIGEVFAMCGIAAALQNSLASLTIQAGQAIDGDRDVLLSMRRRSVAALSTDLPPNKPVHRPFHWPLEFPEVFADARGGFDAVLGNPPYRHGSRVSTDNGNAYLRYLLFTNLDAKGTADLAVYFLRRFVTICRPSGAVGLVTTKSIGEGDNKESGLKWLRDRSHLSLYKARSPLAWPGKADLSVSMFFGFKGGWSGKIVLNDEDVLGISPSLEAARDEINVYPLRTNAGLCYKGSELLGDGFIISEDEAKEMLRSPSTAKIIKRLMNGKDFSSSATQSPGRWVIDFGGMSESEARRHPRAFTIIEQRVKPERAKDNRAARRERYWRYGEIAKGLYSRLQGLERATARLFTGEYWFWDFIAPGPVFTNALVIVASEEPWRLAVLSSAVHEAWAALEASSLVTRFRYTPSRCFETYPFPVFTEALDAFANSFREYRCSVMAGRSSGLTALYGALHDSTCADQDIVALRDMHMRLDCSVLDAYGWGDISLDHGFWRTKQGVRFNISEPARTEVLRRLSELNRQRYEEEHATASPTKPRRTTDRKSAASTAQGTLALVDSAEPDPRAFKTKSVASAKKASIRRTEK